MLKNPKLDFVKRELLVLRKAKKMKPVAAATRVKYTTIKNIAAGIVKDPRGSNLEALYSYLNRGA